MKFVQSKYSFPIAALLTGCFFVLIGCENDERVVNSLFQKKVGVEEGKQITSYLSQDGYVKAKLTAPFMLRYQSTDNHDSTFLEFPRTLHSDFFDSTGKRESYLDARYGKYYETDRKVLLKDSVLVINLKNGDTLRTQKLWWDQNKSEFSTDDTAYIFQPDKVILAANGLTATQNLSNIKFFNSSGVLAVPKSDSTKGVPNDSLPAARPDTGKAIRPPFQRPPAFPAVHDSNRIKSGLFPRVRKDTGAKPPGLFRGKQ